jgi:hypothetical protein
MKKTKPKSEITGEIANALTNMKAARAMVLRGI